MRFFGHGVYTEPCEILRYAQNDRSEVLPQNDKGDVLEAPFFSLDGETSKVNIT